MSHTQSASIVFMVEPTSFGFDDQTARTNAFQHRLNLDASLIQQRAQAEFTELVSVLRRHGIQVVTFRDRPDPPKPNAVFPNNWLSTWPDGRVFLYPMATPSRRRERAAAAIKLLEDTFQVSGVINLSGSEHHQAYLESTGVMVFDHLHRRAYAVISPRCDQTLFEQHARGLGYEPISLHATDGNGQAIYHTNVFMAVQSRTAVICTEAITKPVQRQAILDTLRHTQHAVVEISQAQMSQYCANVLELRNEAGESFLVLSQSAFDAFTPEQRQVLGRDKTLLPVALPTIETIGGGSARCMIAEIFLAPRLAGVLAEASGNATSRQSA